jgi:hypothetical protein
MEELKITGNLPNMVVELSHHTDADTGTEQVVVRLTAHPDFKTALPMLDHLAGGMLAGGMPLMLAQFPNMVDQTQSGGNPWLAWWQHTLQTAWQPWLACNPFLNFLPKDDKNSQ